MILAILPACNAFVPQGILSAVKEGQCVLPDRCVPLLYRPHLTFLSEMKFHLRQERHIFKPDWFSPPPHSAYMSDVCVVSKCSRCVQNREATPCPCHLANDCTARQKLCTRFVGANTPHAHPDYRFPHIHMQTLLLTNIMCRYAYLFVPGFMWKRYPGYFWETVQHFQKARPQSALQQDAPELFGLDHLFMLILLLSLLLFAPSMVRIMEANSCCSFPFLVFISLSRSLFPCLTKLCALLLLPGKSRVFIVHSASFSKNSDVEPSNSR